MVSRIALPWRTYRQLARLIRLPLFCFSGLLPLLGAAPARPSVAQAVVLLGVALCVHVYAGLLNDVVDLPHDRTQSWRRFDPLVTGAVRPQAALAAIAIQPPLALALTRMVGAPGAAYLALVLAFAGITIYDLWGKRTAFPPLTDAVQGLGWAMLVAYGAVAVLPAPPAATLVPCVCVVFYTLMASGIHGNLRDLANDFDRHARTTAILLGARPGPDGPILSAGVMAYGLVVQAGLAATVLLPLVVGGAGLPGDARRAALALGLALQVPHSRSGPCCPTCSPSAEG
jgi:4-hydroxybenzoate polyprenyltransferase